jgi:hypothetical protein
MISSTIPVMAGISNYVVPIQTGARDMAFPRVNAFSFWLLIPAGLLMLSALDAAAPRRRADQPPPLTDRRTARGGRGSLILGLHLAAWRDPGRDRFRQSSTCALRRRYEDADDVLERPRHDRSSSSRPPSWPAP